MSRGAHISPVGGPDGGVRSSKLQGRGDLTPASDADRRRTPRWAREPWRGEIVSQLPLSSCGAGQPMRCPAAVHGSRPHGGDSVPARNRLPRELFRRQPAVLPAINTLPPLVATSSLSSHSTTRCTPRRQRRARPNGCVCCLTLAQAANPRSLREEQSKMGDLAAACDQV